MDIADFLGIARQSNSQPNNEEIDMNWTKPEFIDWRFGFEITLYVLNR